MVPKVLIRVTNLEQCQPASVQLENSVAVSFVSDYQGPAQLYSTYVTFQPHVEGSFEEAVSWMKTEYVEGEYRGRIITDFDQTQTVFPEARLALSNVMDRLVSRGELRETIELMHASASVDSYFDEIARRKLLPNKGRAQRTKIFISYAHAAEENTGWVSRIQTHLGALTYSSDFEVWADTKIEPGQRWQEQIEQAISHTRIAVLVLTADFLASKFIRDAELPPLLEAADADGAAIFCIYGSDVHLSGIAKRLLRYQFVNKPERPLQSLSDAARESVYKELSKAVEKALAGEA
jgi:TIR domain.